MRGSMKSFVIKCLMKLPRLKEHLQPVLSLVLSSLADLSTMTDIHSQEGTFRDLRFNYLLLTLGGAFIVLVLGALILRAATTCCVKQAPPVARPHFKSHFDSFLQKGSGDKL